MRNCVATERGFALLIVLWSVVFLALLMAGILAAGRSAVDLAGNLRMAAQEDAAADGAINSAIFHVLAPTAWPLDGAAHMVTIGGIAVSVRVTSEAGKINPNLASTALLTGLLRATGLAGAPATALAGAITAWRSPPASPGAADVAAAAYRAAGLPYAPPAHQFADLSELADVIGMTPAIFARISPFLSIYQTGDPDPAYASATVVAALRFARVHDPSGNVYEGAPVVRVTACATRCRTAIVAVPGAASLNPFTVLAVGSEPQ
jgi:general secretion pathway protein K